jgi:phospholipid/cholesterol/gamma-HCH transport system substrate-binding protein
MANETTRNIRLGIFVVTGTLILIVALYLMGSKQNLFGSTFSISANFYNVNGLMQGNNVRYSGIDVGTVESITIINDTSVKVVMVIEKKIQPYIKRNALASIGTDGLMGNKLVNINSIKDHGKMIKEGDILEASKPIEMEEMVKTLSSTNDNMKVITYNLKNITNKINSKNSLWSLLMDTVVAENVKSAVVNIKLMSNKSVLITGNINKITENINNGKGSIAALITDTILSYNLKQSVIKLKKISDTSAIISGNISSIVNKINSSKGTIGVLLNDTMLVHNLNKGIISIDNGAGNFNENMKALKYTWPFKKYFKKFKK